MTAPLWPARGEIHILHFTLSLSDPELLFCEQILATDELQRADRLLSRQVRDRFVAGRAFLRRTLARCLNLDPAHVCLSSSKHGKPRLAGEQARIGLSFNLSHSEDRAILALAQGCEVGVDIEHVREDLPFRAMAQHFFSLREQTELFSLLPELQLAAFYRGWTRKEACLKGCGSGFAEPATCCYVSLLPNHTSALLECSTNRQGADRWHLTDIAVPDGFCAALAHNGIVPVRLQSSDWHSKTF